MHDIPGLSDLAVVVTAGVVVMLVLSRLKLPSVTGLIVAGALVGPHGLSLVQHEEVLSALAEVGVVLLLFTIGLEFSLSRLRRIGKLVALGGGMQVGLTTAAVSGVAMLLDEPAPRAVLLGMVVALSSTAIVLRGLAERSETDAPHGRFIVGALIFQDLCVVPMVLLVPILAGEGEGHPAVALSLAAGKAAAVVVGTLLVWRFVVPRLFALVDASRSRELFLMTVVAVCIGTAWLTSLAGLSLALGAFLGGMVLADTAYNHRALGDILPLRDVLASLFFMSLGAMFDGRVLIEAPGATALMLCALLPLKGLVATVAAMVMRFPARAAWLAGAGLAQFGEFGFVLLLAGVAHGLVTEEQVRVLLAAGVISMTVTPLVVLAAPHISAGHRLLRPLERLLGARSIDEPDEADRRLRGHVVVAGYGPVGLQLARVFEQLSVRYVVLELNAETVREARRRGAPVYYADVTSSEALEHAQLPRAAALVLLINDPRATRLALATAQHVAPDVPVLVRTRYAGDRAALIAEGAAEVVSEELQGGFEVLARVLRKVGVPRNVADAHVASARVSAAEASRPTRLAPQWAEHLPELRRLSFDTFLVIETSHVAGRTLRQAGLRQKTGITLVAIRRGDELRDEVSPDEVVEVGDMLFLVGSEDGLCRASYLLQDGTVQDGCPV